MGNWVLHIVFGILALQVQAQCSCDSLVAAIKAEDTLAVKTCLESGTDPNCYADDFRPDSTNIINDDNQVVAASVNYHWRTPPLITALRTDQFYLVQELIEAGASPNKSERCIEEVTFKEPMNFRSAPLQWVKFASIPEKINTYLIENDAISAKEMELRGKRMQRLATHYDTDVRPCKDSILLLHQLMKDWGVDVLFDEEFIVNNACYANDIVLLTYLVNEIEVAVKERTGGYISVGSGVFRRTIYKEGFSAITALYVNENLTVSAIELLQEVGIISDVDKEKYFIQKSGKEFWGYKKVRKYYSIESKMEKSTNLTDKKKDKYREKMQKNL